MKTTLLLLSTWLVAVVSLAQDSPIGNYSMSEWAHTNLNVNRVLESGAAGKLLGYQSTGVIGLLDPPSGGGGTDTNGVAAVPDLATLTNLTGYTKAIVGDSNTTTQSLYQKVYLPKRPRNEWYVSNPPQVFTDNPDGSTTVSGSTVANLGAYFGTYDIVGTRGTLVFLAKTSLTSTLNTPGQWDETQTQWYTTQACSPSWAQYSATFLADGSNPVNITYPVNSVPTETITFYDVRYVEGDLPMPEPFYASATEPDYVWRPVGLESSGGGGGALTSKTVDIPSVAYQFVPDTDVIVVNSTIPDTLGFDYVFTSQPIILPGTAGQFLTISNVANADLVFTRGTGYGINSAESVFVLDDTYSYVGYFQFNGTTGVWDAYGKLPIYQTGTQVNLLPAPWPPPDTNGVQVLPANVKNAFLRELVPYLLTNYPVVFPNGPVPGTSANPIVP